VIVFRRKSEQRKIDHPEEIQRRAFFRELQQIRAAQAHTTQHSQALSNLSAPKNSTSPRQAHALASAARSSGEKNFTMGDSHSRPRTT